MVQELKAVLLHGKLELPVIAGLTPEQSLDHHSLTHPELATATIGEGKVDISSNKIVYKVDETFGTKG